MDHDEIGLIRLYLILPFVTHSIHPKSAACLHNMEFNNHDSLDAVGLFHFKSILLVRSHKVHGNNVLWTDKIKELLSIEFE